MIKKKKFGGKLLPTKVGAALHPPTVKKLKKKKKGLIMKTSKKVVFDAESTSDFADEDFGGPEFEKENTKKAGGMKKRWTPEEDQYIVRGCTKLWQQESPVPLEILDQVAEKANIRFHESQPIRSGDGLWWRINRGQKEGDQVFADVTISGGSPKRSKGTAGYRDTQSVVARERTASKQVISSAIKKPVMPNPPVKKEIKQAPKNKVGKVIQLIIKDELGNIEKVLTAKFNSIEELLFAIS